VASQGAARRWAMAVVREKEKKEEKEEEKKEEEKEAEEEKEDSLLRSAFSVKKHR
jgi:ribosomal protein L12E/L44/L45/RPP1/RPP2